MVRTWGVGSTRPEQGQLVVLRGPDGADLVKRVAGVPDDLDTPTPGRPGLVGQDGVVFMESEGKRRTIRITVWVAVLGLLLGVLSSIIGAVSADAHAALKSVTPGDGATVSTVPTTVTLSFNEPIGTTFATVTVTGPSGDVGNGRPKVEGTTVTEELDPNLPDGAYKVAFRVVSEDGHPVSDTTSFTIKAAPSSPTSEPTLTPGNGAASPSPSSAASTESPAAATASDDNSSQSMRLGLAFGVGALAVAGGIALVAAVRRRGRS